MFTWYDYILLAIMLGVSAIIGIYFGFFEKQNSEADYLLGGKKMTVFPISMSLIASSISGITLLAVPADIYRYGVTYWFSAPMMLVVGALTYIVYLPVFYKLQVTSIYEYLELRFNEKIRVFSSVLYTISVLLYLPIVIYVAALALSHVTGMHIHLFTPIVCGICIFYTTIGGLKAVVWTDTLQFVTMIVTVVALFVMGIFWGGGVGAVWKKSSLGGRLDIDFSFDLTKRDTIWTGTFAMLFIWSSQIAVSQGHVQKCIALPKFSDVKRAIIIFSIGMFIFMSASVYIGLIMFARYFECDPLLLGIVKRSDQLLPHYVIEVAKSVPGFPGLFIAGIVSAALSTLSAVLNGLAGSVYEDLLSKFLPQSLSQSTISTILKLLVVIIGLTCTSLVFVIEQLGSLLPLVFSLSGVTTGAILELFSVGMLVPMVNSVGALCGGICSLVMMIWIVVGSQYNQTKGLIHYPPLATYTRGCNDSQIITNKIFNTSFPEISQEAPFILYRISFYYYTVLGLLLVFLVSISVSYCTKDSYAQVNRNCITPMMQFLLPKSSEIAVEAEIQNVMQDAV